jgi:hypothetical protein
MQEVLSKTTDTKVSLREQEYFRLQIDDLGFPFRPLFLDSLGAVVRDRFLVREAHAAWSEIGRNVTWGEFEHDECSTLEEAEWRYVRRRAAIVEKGFIYSDMDF